MKIKLSLYQPVFRAGFFMPAASAVGLLVLALLLAGCGGNMELRLRARVQTFTQALMDDKFDDAVDFMDPEVVTSKGRTQAANELKLVVEVVKALVRAGGRKPDGFAIRKVDFDTANLRATVQVVYFTTDMRGGDRKEHPTDQKWVMRRKTWYFTSD